MKLKDLSNQLEISLGSLQNFINDFNIDLSFCIDENFNVTEEFIDFSEKNIDFLKKYAEDHSKEKTIEEIAKTIGAKEEEVLHFFVSNGIPAEVAKQMKTAVSSYLIHSYIGGKYPFIEKAFPQCEDFSGKSLVGYTDLYFYLTDMLDPFISKDQVKRWGISKPAGLVLYGPPGSGKIYWARKIADMIGYEFVHVFNDYLIGNFDSKKNKFSDFLSKKMNQPNTLLFIDSFDELLHSSSDNSISPEMIDLFYSVLRHIQKNDRQELLIVGAVESLSILNDEIVAPGRFDMHIPIFPPTLDERIQLILHHLTANLALDSPLLTILKNQNALNKDFWTPYAAEMRLFSNTMLIDFTQSLKKRLYALFRKDETKNIMMTEKVLFSAFQEAKSKLTPDYLRHCAIFVNEAQQNVGQDFPHRLIELNADLEFYLTTKEIPITKIGFKQSDESVDLNTNQSSVENNEV
ncbi:ATP-binding protein [Empedobacter falsenii]|uniref:AAA family ATPase n=1 Tax=Empedobacter TaxID=59734 RepID=UPI001CE1311E|nr:MULTISPECIES: ATP-binding protein [Empedobacter]MCA4776372.1 ATP-binding protein [Empedobacter stercoris]MDM1522947.1 ATP-binding protein [Empedobacter sp. 225-1]MDM1542987.1 ATP-binding protein [Empedobacter sp. 189-2]